MDRRTPEERRRLRLTLPPALFLGDLLALTALVAAIVLVVYFVLGPGEGAE